jgi:hypothetical protein
VTTDIHAVAFVLDGARDAANIAAAFKHDWLDLRPAKELDCGGQTGWSSADNHCRFAHRTPLGISEIAIKVCPMITAQLGGSSAKTMAVSLTMIPSPILSECRCLSGAEASGRFCLGIDLWRTKLLLKHMRP